MNEAALIEEEVVEAPSLRETIEEAFDEQVAKEPAVPGEVKPAEPIESSIPAAVEAQVPEAEKPTETAPVVPGELKAPSQWKPAVREKWNALPLEVKQEVLRREADSMRLIGSVGPKIRLADEVSTHLQPFQERLQSTGSSTSSFLGDVFATVKSLSSGTPQDKAEVVANIVQSYGVDLRTLDAILSRRIGAGPEVEEARRLAARARSVLEQQAQTTQQQSSLEAERTLAAFAADPKHEFLNDVRDLMADLVESGRVGNLEDAYSAAVWAHPDTRKILLGREATTRATTKSGRAAQARKASSAVHGTPVSGTGVPGLGPKASLRETIEAAFDEHSS